jgi:two-component system CheB/CheR fusion protein
MAPMAPSGSQHATQIVGIGASAGGLEAFEQFFKQVKPDSGLAYVLIQHLDPSQPSMLVDILQRCTSLPVVEAKDQMAVEPDHVYVIPPNRGMQVFHGLLQLSSPVEARGLRMPIDAFFRSLAEDQGDAAVGIILSGTGTDGTLGLRALFGAGSLCLVQDPSTARHDGMPRSAIDAGYANQVLAPQAMPELLRRGVKPSQVRQPMITRTSAAVGALNRILMQLRTGTGHDFSQYKTSTIGRRIERRMTMHAIEDPEVYARFIKDHPGELQALFRELLINVTSFFRDPEAFDALNEQVLRRLVHSKDENDTIRIWVAACATGEEAYSIAIMLRELMDAAHKQIKVQLYSTDLDDDAIATARAGLYPPNIEQDVKPERLSRFFVKEESGYRVRKHIRDMVIFAVQSVVKDPPFTRLDLLTCRNLLIYLEAPLQDRLITTFHYALKPDGVLFLSPSESIGGHTELFESIDRKWKLYRQIPSAASARTLVRGGVNWHGDTGSSPARPDSIRKLPEPLIGDAAKRMLMHAFAPAAVVTDPQGNILYVHGDTGRFLHLPQGQPNNNVVDMACEGLQTDLREALRLAATMSTPTLNKLIEIRGPEGNLPLSLSVRLMPEPETGHNVLLVSFQERPKEHSKTSRAAKK